MNNLYTVKTKNNLVSLLKNFKEKIVIIFIFKFSCEISKKMYSIFISTAKTIPSAIFVLLNIDVYQPPNQLLAFPELRYYFNSELLHKYKCTLNDSLQLLIPKIFSRLNQLKC